MKKYLVGVLIIAILVGLYFGASSPKNKDSQTNQQATEKSGWYNGTIKVGHLVALDMAPMFIAKEAGFFAEEGLDVETVFFSNPGDNNAALAGGELQFHINPFTLPFLGENQGSPMRIISSAGGLEIIEVVIQGEYDVETVQELKQWKEAHPNEKLKIGTLKGDTLDMIIYKALLEEGMTYDDFEMVWFNDLLAMVQAFQTEEIAILSHIKPYTTDLVLNYDANVLTNNDIVRGEGTPNTTTVVMQEFLEKYPETIKAYLRAQQKGFQYLVDQPEAAVDLLVEGNYYRVDKETLLYAAQNQPKKVRLQPNVEGMMSAIQDMVSQGYINPVDERVVNTTFLDALGIQ